MSIVSIRAALETAVNSMSPALATAWENRPFTPTAGTAYQKVFLLFADPDNVEYGSNHREIGYMQITLMYPLQTGSADISARAELIRSTFYRGASFSSGGLSVIINKTPAVGRFTVDGDRFALPVKIYFFCNISN